MDLNPGLFTLVSEFDPRGDQPGAIEALVGGIRRDLPYQTLLGVTGSGKTFTIASVIARVGLPVLVVSHNKTLAAQLYSELREFFPRNAVGYFVSYYDYYQPEAYIPQRDIYIEKDASINDDIDRMRLAATSALTSRRDVVIVSSVSCLYGLGDPAEYQDQVVRVGRGGVMERDDLLRRLVNIQYDRKDIELARGTFRVRGDVVEVHPAYEEGAYRIELFGDTVEAIQAIDPLSGEVLGRYDEVTIYPAKHFVIARQTIERAVRSIREELELRLEELHAQGKSLEAQRLSARARYDMELLLEIGYCPGIENYSRHLSGRKPGERPYNLLDYFPEDFLVVVDESHVTIPQIGGMYEADRSRKQTLVDYGFRLPSALDNRPMRFDEWEEKVRRAVFVSATPGPYEMGKSGPEVVELINRPTGLVDPLVKVRPAKGQVEDLLQEVRRRSGLGQRILVTTLTKRMAEDLSDYLLENGVRCRYLHSEIDTIERVEILQDLRRGRYDVVVGVNLLREGLDLPEVALVAILDADKEGFLRSATSLIQTIGRAARNDAAEVYLYAEVITDSMRRAMEETRRRRELQEAFNREHGIVPRSVRKAIRAGIDEIVRGARISRDAVRESEEVYGAREAVFALEAEMLRAAEALEFERAAELRDRIEEIRSRSSQGGSPRGDAPADGSARPGPSP